MDPLTHVLVGASLGYAGFGRRLGRTSAWVGGLAAFIPDADIFIRSENDPLLAIEYHRHFTHALAFAPLGAALVVGIALLQARHRAHWLTLWVCATSAYASHCLLDAATSYGTQLLWPFSSQRFGWDLVSIIDPIFTAMLAIPVGLALIRRYPRAATAGLILGGSYLVVGAVQHARATRAQAALVDVRGHTRERLEIMPTMANNLVWRALYLHNGRIYSDRIRVGWFSGATVRNGWSVPLMELAQLNATEAARNQHRSFERFAWFSDGWVARSPRDETVLADMRYSLSAEAFDPIWGIRFNNSAAGTDVLWINRTRDRQIKPTELWREVIGQDNRFQPVNQVK